MGKDSIGINYNLTTRQPDTALYNIETGIIEVARRGGIYEFNIDVYIDHEKQVKGYFVGVLDEHLISGK